MAVLHVVWYFFGQFQYVLQMDLGVQHGFHGLSLKAHRHEKIDIGILCLHPHEIAGVRLHALQPKAPAGPHLQAVMVHLARPDFPAHQVALHGHAHVGKASQHVVPAGGQRMLGHGENLFSQRRIACNGVKHDPGLFNERAWHMSRIGLVLLVNQPLHAGKHAREAARVGLSIKARWYCHG